MVAPWQGWRRRPAKSLPTALIERRGETHHITSTGSTGLAKI
jgi:hypothetical protein